MGRGMNRLLAFYYGSHPDHRGRTLAEILKQDDFWLEVTHDYIQWLFPLREMSRVNLQAPLADEKTVEAFRSDELLCQHLLASYQRMLAFFGLRRLPDGMVVKSPAWGERKREWFSHDSHNSLRITRMLRSLALLGLEDEARGFQGALADLCASEPDCKISQTSQAFWREAVSEKD